MNIWRNQHMTSAKSSHDLGFSAPNEFDTWSRRNQHTISMKSTHDLNLAERTSWFLKKWISSTHTIDFKWSHQTQIDFVVPSGNSLQTPISIVKILNFSSAIQIECIIHAFPTIHHRETIPYEPNVSTTQQLNGTPFQMTLRRTQHEPTLTLQLTSTPSQMSSRWSNQIWVEHTKYQHRLNKPNARPLCKLNYLLTGRSNVHRDHNTSRRREV